ncbi:MAG: hypothetical protein KDA05_07865 [Phycisphaerales bacterium]|nr:hypothetical protein [Phycisphaerales bacterium]
MRALGVWLIIFAVGSFVLPMLGMQFIILAWIGMWGPTVALLIQGAMLALGVLLIVLSVMGGRPRQNEQPQHGQPMQGPPYGQA